MEENQFILVVTFSPVQEFIEKSRKLRDLYGSSFLLSYLSYFTANAAEAISPDVEVIGPGILPDTISGTSDEIIILSKLSQTETEQIAQRLKTAFNFIWGRIVDLCREWLREEFPNYNYTWNRHWNSWKNNAWEFFWGIGEKVDLARQDLYNREYHSRVWIGVNWEGDSSDLSGGDAIAFPDMAKSNPVKSDHKTLELEITQYYQDLSYRIGEIYSKKGASKEEIRNHGESIISPREKLNILELIKRLVMTDVVANRINDSQKIKPPDDLKYLQPVLEKTKIEKLKQSFKDINRFEEDCWSGWFVGDGDSMGKYTRTLLPSKLKEFNLKFHRWSEENFKEKLHREQLGRLVYAGGDDFMGIFIPENLKSKTKAKGGQSGSYLTGKRCMEWWEKFPNLWAEHTYDQEVTVSVGFVWAAPNTPQRAVLQHCSSAEQNAKNTGKDRIAIRVLFNSGNYLEWSCPWWFISHLIECERAKWVKMYQDVIHLEGRHGFDKKHDVIVAQEIFGIYFSHENKSIFDRLWNSSIGAGILGDRQLYIDAQGNFQQVQANIALNDWVINLAKVGFHLFRHES